MKRRQRVPQFDEGFNNARPFTWGVWGADDREWYDTCKRKYEQVWMRGEEDLEKNTPKENVAKNIVTCRGIPHIIHHVWLGSEFPSKFEELRQGWMNVLPDWDFRLWGDADVNDILQNENRPVYNAAKDYGGKSDVLRYEILRRFGGVYVDVDFICVASILDMCESLDFFAGISSTRTMELNNGIIGCTPNHPIITHVMNCVRTTHEQHEKNMGLLSKALVTSAASGWIDGVDAKMVQDLTTTSSYNDMATIRRTGPGAFTMAVMDCLIQQQKEPRYEIADQYDRSALFPPSFFYPLPNNVTMKRTCWSVWLRQAECYIIPGVTKAVHLWARTWQCGGNKQDETDSHVTG